jgi:general secretion pathway protein M
MTGPSGIRGKALALGLLVAAGLAVYSVAIEPLYLEYVQLQQSIDQSHRLLAKYRKLEGGRAGLEADIAEMKTRDSRDGDYLTAASETLAGAEIQGRLKTVFESVGAEQRSVQTLAPETADGLIRVTVRAQFTAESAALYQLLYQLETEAPLLFVDNLDIRRKQNRRRRRREAAEAQPDAAGPLDVRMDLYGYLRGPAA